MKRIKNNNKRNAVKANVRINYKGDVTVTLGEITIKKSDEIEGRMTETTFTMAETKIESKGDMGMFIKAFKELSDVIKGA